MSNLPSPILGLGRICGRGLAIFLVLLGWITSLAVAQPLAFRHFDDRDGLPQSQIRAILEDREGFLWIGTVEGLARLGASGFRPYRSQEQLRPTMVNCLMQDRRGSLWVGGDESGVAEIRGSRVRNFGEAEGLDITNVYSLLKMGTSSWAGDRAFFASGGTGSNEWYCRIPGNTYRSLPWRRIPGALSGWALERETSSVGMARRFKALRYLLLWLKRASRLSCGTPREASGPSIPKHSFARLQKGNGCPTPFPPYLGALCSPRSPSLHAESCSWPWAPMDS